jgi:DMSO reductase family type II enzyme chaperone
MEMEPEMDVTAECPPAEEISRVYRLLGRCFSYPDSELYESFTQAGITAEVEQLIKALPFHVDHQCICRFSHSHEEVETRYTTLFDIPLCPIPLQETIYRKGEMSREDVQEGVVRFFEHFGLGLKPEERDFPDNVVAELEFMSYLTAKEANAETEGKDTAPYRLGQRDFLSRHLCKWFKRMNQKMQKLVDEPFYQGIGNFTKEFLDTHLIYLRKVLREPLQANGRTSDAADRATNMANDLP